MGERGVRRAFAGTSLVASDRVTLRHAADASLGHSLQRRHDGVMMKVNISELRDHLSRYLDHVRAGGRVLVLDRQRPVAEIVPVSPLQQDDEIDGARLAALEREGLISCATRPIPAELLRPTSAGRGAKVLQALLDERAAGR